MAVLAATRGTPGFELTAIIVTANTSTKAIAPPERASTQGFELASDLVSRRRLKPTGVLVSTATFTLGQPASSDAIGSTTRGGAAGLVGSAGLVRDGATGCESGLALGRLVGVVAGGDVDAETVGTATGAT